MFQPQLLILLLRFLSLLFRNRFIKHFVMWDIKPILIFGITLFTIPPVFSSCFKLCIFEFLEVIIVNYILTLITLNKLPPLTNNPAIFDDPIILIHDQLRPHQVKTAILRVKVQSILLNPVEVWDDASVTHSRKLLKLLCVVL